MPRSLGDHFSWLDVCRTIAICCVLISHGRHFFLPVTVELNALKTFGFIGVELFFVLSGFLIGRILISSLSINAGFRWVLRFWGRRWFRTLPNYYLFLAINCALGFFSVRPASSIDLFEYVVFCQNLLSPIPAFYEESWSLAVEEIFYLFSPIVFLIAFRLRKKSDLSVLCASLLIVFLCVGLRFVRVSIGPADFGPDIRNVVVYRFDAIMFGVLLSWVYVEREACFDWLLSKKALFLRWGLFLLFPMSIWIASMPDIFLNESYFARVFLFPLASLGSIGLVLVGLGSNVKGKIGVFFANGARWSYAAYLTNLPCYFLMKHHMEPASSWVGCVAQFMLFFVLSFVCAALVYTCYEKHFLMIRDKILKNI